MNLGRVQGIAISIHASWLLIFALVVYTLGAGYFAMLLPGWPPWQVWGYAVLSSLLFFLCVVLHELGHALVAKRQGFGVDGITLFLLGGVARMRAEPATPQAELQVALAGPAASIVLAALFGLASLALGGIEGTPPLGAITAYLAFINALVVAFNMVPAFPLDGGRTLRALLWWRIQDVARATRLASAGGKAFGILLMAGGLAFAGFGHFFNGLWFLLVGWFLTDAAASHYAQTLSQYSLAGVPLSEILEEQPNAVSGDTTIQELVDTRLGYSSPDPVPVVHEGRIEGLVGIPEVKRIDRAAWPFTTARDAMAPVGVYAVASSEHDAWDTLVSMSERSLDWMAVFENGEFRGLVSPRRLLQYARRRQGLAGA